MVFVPRMPFSAGLLGLTGGPPRAVPSDAVVAVASLAVPAAILQKAILLLIFVLACSGAAALLASGWAAARGAGSRSSPPVAAGGATGEPVRGRAAADRPVGAAARVRGAALGDPAAGRPAGSGSGCPGAGRHGSAAVGGFAAMSVTALAAVPVALVSSAPGWRLRRLSGGARLPGRAQPAVAGPAFVVAVQTDPRGVDAFAAGRTRRSACRQPGHAVGHLERADRSARIRGRGIRGLAPGGGGRARRVPAAWPGRSGGARPGCRGLSLKLEHVGLLVLEHVLGKAGSEGGEPFGDFRETCFGGSIKTGPRPAEGRVIAFEHARLLGAERELAALAPECVDACKQCVIEPDLIPVRGELGRDLALDRQQGVVAVCACERVKQRRDACERPAAALQRRDCIVETRRLRVGRNGIDLAQVRGERLHEPVAERVRRDFGKWRHLERGVPGGEDRVGS